ncbi:MAG: dUTP diphosphatase [Pelagibacteraceae bacterium]
MKEKVLIKKLHKDVKIPEYKTQGSSGLDLEAFIEQDLIIKPGNKELIPTGLSVSIPENLEIQIRPRSGLALKNGLTVLNTPGTVDADYRGEIKVILINLSSENYIVKKGDRIAQMVLCPIVKASFELVDELPESLRSSGGFGSTGKN